MISDNDDSPRARVDAFIADWHATWGRAKDEMGDRVDFVRWRALIRELDERFFVSGAGCGSAGSFSNSHPDHEPANETFVEEVIEGDRARVETRTNHVVAHHYEYSLTKVNGAWKIARLIYFLDPRGTPLVAEDAREAMLAEAREDAPLEPLPVGVTPNGDALFHDGREVTRREETTILEVKRLGTIETRSGILGVRDFAYDAYGFHPLRRKFAPGTYPVDVVSPACASV